MPVVYTLPTPKSDIWYLAYGSNLSRTKFIHDRSIIPISSALVTVPGWALAIDSAGVPYSEPGFASISPIPSLEDGTSVQLIGTAYKLTPEMYAKVLASEGGGIAYAEVEVRAQMLRQDDMDDDTKRSGIPSDTFATRSLVTLLRREARPSVRYMVSLP
jgi:hypothetical protein